MLVMYHFLRKKLVRQKKKLIDERDPKLQAASWENTHPYVPEVQCGKVIKVYDGDTITIAARAYLNGPVCRFSVRLDGIDTPELRSKDENEKKFARKIQVELEKKILGRFVRLVDVKLEKYGRLLATVWFEDNNINEWLLAGNYAVRYDGGTRHFPPDWFNSPNS